MPPFKDPKTYRDILDALQIATQRRRPRLADHVSSGTREASNKISIDGHTDSKPYATTGSYSNCELSSDRANAARRLMQADGVGSSHVTQVRGFADQRLRKPDNPFDSSNRRVSLVVQHVIKGGDEEDVKRSAGSEAKKPGKQEPFPSPKIPGEKK